MTDEKHPLWQAKNGTKAECESANPVLLNGEIAVQTDTGKVAVGDGTRRYNTLDKTAMDSEVYHAEKFANRLYSGKSLVDKHREEYRYSYNDNIFAWLQARRQAGNYEGINLWDSLTFQRHAGTVGTNVYTEATVTAYVSAIDLYYEYGDNQQVGHHIDFLAGTIGKNVSWNPTNNNNGSEQQQVPWLQSNLYAYLNGKNNSATAQNGQALGGDYSSGGFIDLLPAELKAVMREKRLYMPKRYSGSGILTTSNAGQWCDVGKLYTFAEGEIYGRGINSVGKSTDGGIDFDNIGTPRQYPIFANGDYSRALGRVGVWLSSVATGVSARACNLNYNGSALTGDCTNPWFSCPLAFRI